MKRTLLTFALLVCAIFAFAQKNGTITGILADSTDHKNKIGYATISIYKAGDTVLSNYRLSDEKGAFKIANLETGMKYRIVVNAWQYKVYRKDVSVTAEDSNVDLGELYLTTKDNMVDEVVITAERPPIIVRKDTIEFNAESFKTLPTAVVEDLLKKLPGVRIGENGQIEVNGKAVSKILVDGKEFFGGDQQIATKNLPANIIDKIQVSDDMEAKRRDPDLVPGNTPQVINLKLKKAIKQGAFGKLYGGGGPDEHFEAGGIMSFFRDTTQVSVLAYGNNINRPGFSINEIGRIGGFDRAGYSSMMVSSDGGFALDDISFGGLGSGVIKSLGGGFNFNTLTKGGVKINGRYFYGQTNALLNQQINDNQSIGADNFISDSRLNSRTRTYNHAISARIEWQADSLNNLIFNPVVMISPQRFNNLQNKTATSGSGTPINTSYSNSLRSADNYKYSVLFSWFKDFKKRGRSLNMSLSGSKSDNLDDNYNASGSHIVATNISTDIDQLRDNNITNNNAYLSLNYTEPIAKKLSFVTGFSATYLNNENALYTYYKDPSNQAYDIFVPNSSETVNQKGLKTALRANFRWAVNKNLSIQPGIVFNTIDLSNSFTHYPAFEQHYSFFFPQLIVRYKALTFSYQPSFSEPDVQYIQPVSNNTDQSFIQRGNVNLLPAKTHRVSMNLYKYDAKRTMNYNFFVNGSIKNDGVIMSRVLQPDGVQISTPINADGIKAANAGATFTKDFKSPKRQFAINFGVSGNYNENIVDLNGIRSRAHTLSAGPRIGGRMNLNDKLEFNETYSLSIADSRYESDFYQDRQVISQYNESELILRSGKLVFETIFKYQVTGQDIAGYTNNLKIWNAGLTFLFMKNNRAQLKLSVNDILQSNVRRYVYITDNSIRDTQSNNLGRYGLLTFTYNIQNFGGKVGGKERFFGF